MLFNVEIQNCQQGYLQWQAVDRECEDPFQIETKLSKFGRLTHLLLGFVGLIYPQWL